MFLIDFLSILKKKLNCYKRSYSFGSVDLLINYYFKNKKKGIYLDVGCQHPVSNNNTYLLFKKGWSGINIDLDQKSIELFNLVRNNDINLNTAVSSSVTEKKLFFYHDKSAINTLDEDVSNFQSAKVKEIRNVKTNTLNNILNENNIKKIDYLNIDVEGHEIDVLNGFDIKKYSPEIVSIEYLDLKMKRLEFKNNDLKNVVNSEIYKYMDSNGFSLINWNHADLIFINNNFRD